MYFILIYVVEQSSCRLPINVTTVSRSLTVINMIEHQILNFVQFAASL